MLLPDILAPDLLVFPNLVNALRICCLLRATCMVVRLQPRTWRMKMMVSQCAILLPVLCFLRLWFGSESFIRKGQPFGGQQ